MRIRRVMSEGEYPDSCLIYENLMFTYDQVLSWNTAIEKSLNTFPALTDSANKIK